MRDWRLGNYSGVPIFHRLSRREGARMFLADLSTRYPLMRGKKPLLLLIVIGMAVALGIMAPRQPVLAIGAEIAILMAIGILAKPDIATMAVLGVLYTNA